MALKDTWQDKIDGVDIIYAKDINEIANSVIDIEKKEGNETNIGLAETLAGNETDKAPSVKAVNEGLAKKLDKTTEASKVYGTDADGNPTVFGVSTGADKNNIVQRQSDGQIIVKATPTANEHAASKEYVDTGLANKVNKITASGYRVYASDNGTFKQYSLSPIGNSGLVAWYSVPANSGTGAEPTGTLSGCTPTNKWHFANKKYVNDEDKKLSSRIDKLEIGATNALGERVQTVAESIWDYPMSTYNLPENILPFIRLENVSYTFDYGLYTDETMSNMETGSVNASVWNVNNGNEWVVIPEDGYVQLAEGATSIEFETPEVSIPDGAFMMRQYWTFNITYQVKVGA